MGYPIVNGGPMIPAKEFRNYLAGGIVSAYLTPVAPQLNPVWGFGTGQAQVLLPGTNQTDTFADAPQVYVEVGDSGGIWKSDFSSQAAVDLQRAKILDANSRFYVVHQDGRLRTNYIYVPYKGYMVCAGTWQTTDTSDWSDIRGGLIFVGSVAVGGYLSAGAAAGADAAIAAETTQAIQYVTQAGSLVGNSDITTIGKVAGIVAGNIGTVDQALDQTASQVATWNPTQGVSMDWDFDFSSGEAFPAYTDASNVDFGLGQYMPDNALFDPDSITGIGGTTDEMIASYGDPDLTFGATPEVSTNDYGTTFDPFGGSTVDTAVKSVSLAGQVAGVVSGGSSKPSTGQVAGTTAKPASSGQGSDIMGTIGSVYNAILSGAKTAAGVAQQVETVQGRKYVGQLTPTGGLPTAQAQSQMNMLLIAGAGLLVIALLLHSKG